MTKALDDSFSVSIPWPHRKLSPNARVHWADRAKHKRVARAEAYYLTLAALQGKPPPHSFAGANLCLRLFVYPPDRRKRDEDNLLASLKGQLDGICEALGVDDSQIKELRIIWCDELRGEINVSLSVVRE